jgi:hypothetical protein
MRRLFVVAASLVSGGAAFFYDSPVRIAGADKSGISASVTASSTAGFANSHYTSR